MGDVSEAETSNIIDDAHSREGLASVEWAVTEGPRVQAAGQGELHADSVPTTAPCSRTVEYLQVR